MIIGGEVKSYKVNLGRQLHRLPGDVFQQSAEIQGEFKEVAGRFFTHGGRFIMHFGESQSGSFLTNSIVADEGTDAKAAHLYLPLAPYPWYLDLLRNQRPITFTINDQKPDEWELRTEWEHVGQGEL